MSVRVLAAEDPEGRSAWADLWERAGREPFGHPGYVELFCSGDERAICVANSRGAYMPLIVRQLREVASGATGEDVISPYGYGGPFTPTPDAAEGFLDLLADWSETRGLASVYGRMSLDLNVRQSPIERPGRRLVHTSSNVRVDLTRSYEEVWKAFEHKVRKNVNKARRAGCTVDSSSSMNVDEFHSVYAATMARRDAAVRYRFSIDFFHRLSLLPIEARYYTVRDSDGEAISVEAVLCSESSCFSYLGGTLASAFPMAPNDLLKAQVVSDFAGGKKSWYVLGGGYAPDDGIFRYKRSFAPGGVVPYYTFRCVSSPDLYARTARLAGQARAGVGADVLEADFFPSYRS